MTKPRLASAGEALSTDSETDAIIAAHDGDARAAIAALTEDTKTLRRELALARIAVPRGFSRGWHSREGRPE